MRWPLPWTLACTSSRNRLILEIMERMGIMEIMEIMGTLGMWRYAASIRAAPALPISPI
jgi:hypothetical protein